VGWFRAEAASQRNVNWGLLDSFGMPHREPLRKIGRNDPVRVVAGRNSEMLSECSFPDRSANPLVAFRTAAGGTDGMSRR